MEHTESPTTRARRYNVAVRLADVLWGAGVRNPDTDLGLLAWDLAVTTAAAIERANAHAENRKPDWQPAGNYSPSDRTRELVAGIISYRARTTAQPEVDVFAGLPGVDD